MLEAKTKSLGPPTKARPADGRTELISVREGDVGVRFSLRLGQELQRPALEALGLPSAFAINSFAATARCLSCRLGPDEWYLIGPPGDAEWVSHTLQTILGDRHFSLTDVTHRSLTIFVSGVAAAAVLNGGCPLDLSDEAFPVGTATRTVFERAEILLLRLPGEALFQVEVWRSLRPYVLGKLEELSRFAEAEASASSR